MTSNDCDEEKALFIHVLLLAIFESFETIVQWTHIISRMNLKMNFTSSMCMKKIGLTSHVIYSFKTFLFSLLVKDAHLVNSMSLMSCARAQY